MADLSSHFTVEEMTATSHQGIDNTPAPGIIAALTKTAALLEQVRTFLGGRPISISSGYRCPALNAAVGGVSDSAHLYGYGADFECPSFGDPLAICRALAAANIIWDQLIEEGTWVHISSDPRARRQILTKNPAGGYQQGLPPQ